MQKNVQGKEQNSARISRLSAPSLIHIVLRMIMRNTQQVAALNAS
jgi:hypothetical protein